MNLKKISLISLLCLFLSFSCKEEEKGPTKMQEVMAIHDEVMPKMSTIGKLVGTLKAKEDSTEIGLSYKKARIDLQEANTAMMDWMRNFGDGFNSDEILNNKELSPEKKALLLVEEQSINMVATKINTSIKNAEELLKNQNN